MNSVIQKDVIDFLKSTEEKPRLILTDPPYGMNYKTSIPGSSHWNKSGKTKGKFSKLYGDTPGDIDFDKVFKSCYECLLDDGFLFVFCNWRSYISWSKLIESNGFVLKTPIFWNKKCANGGDLRDPPISVVEMVIRASKGKPQSYPVFNEDNELKKKIVNCWDYGRVPKSEYCGHPTQKPVFLCEQLIRMATKEGEYVVDPFCGVSSTLVAAKQLSRRFDGCDIDNEFVSKSKSRLREIPYV